MQGNPAIRKSSAERRKEWRAQHREVSNLQNAYVLRDLGEAALWTRPEQAGTYEVGLKGTHGLLGRLNNLGFEVKCKGCKCVQGASLV
jgi:hypothetical protein